MKKIPVGGHKKRAFRLKKKHDKWLQAEIGDLILTTLDGLPLILEKLIMGFPSPNWKNIFNA